MTILPMIITMEPPIWQECSFLVSSRKTSFSSGLSNYIHSWIFHEALLLSAIIQSKLISMIITLTTYVSDLTLSHMSKDSLAWQSFIRTHMLHRMEIKLYEGAGPWLSSANNFLPCICFPLPFLWWPGSLFHDSDLFLLAGPQADGG